MAMAGHPAGFTESVVHHLTAQLLEAQHKNARLQAENREVRHMLELAGGANAAAAGAAAAYQAPPSGTPRHASGGMAASQVDTNGSPSSAPDDGDETTRVDSLLRRMHSMLDDQARQAMLRKESGLSCMSHEDVKVVVDRCTSQLAMLDTLQARRQRDLSKRVDNADHAAVSALSQQLQALKDENEALRQKVGSLQTDVARLTTETEEAKFLKQERTDLEHAHQSTTRAMQKQLAEATQEKAALAKKLRAAEEKVMRLQNQVDDMQHLREEKDDIERAYLAQVEHMAKLRDRHQM